VISRALPSDVFDQPVKKPLFQQPDNLFFILKPVADDCSAV
jgi:hypothetical protein